MLTRKAEAAQVRDPRGAKDTLLVATGAGPALASATEQTVTAVEAVQQRSVRVVDISPAQDGDGRGLTSFSLVIVESSVAEVLVTCAPKSEPKNAGCVTGAADEGRLRCHVAPGPLCARGVP